MSDLRAQLQAALGDAHALERELGGGGMSRVFIAEEKAFGRKVVVKLLSPDLAAGVNVDRFQREIQLAANLQHPNIVPVLSAGEMDGLPYYIMPFVEGESLRARLARESTLGVDETLGVLRDVARALDYAHARGVVHRDIKPDNILLSRGAATVADFGIAKALTASRTQEEASEGPLTRVGISIGTPAYMAPEQAAGDPATDHRADIYALGCTAYEMLTGRPVFASTSLQRIIAAHMGEAPQPIVQLRRDLPPAIADLVMRCLAKEPDDRPRDAAELLKAIEHASHGDRTPRTVKGALLGYALAFAAVAVVARAAMIGFGFPEWLFYGALAIMAVAMPGVVVTRSQRWTAYAVGAFVLLVAGTTALRAAGIGPFRTLIGSGALNEGDRILVDEFSVANTSDTVLGRAISEGVRSDLAQYKGIRFVADDRVAGALESMDRPRTTRLTFDVAREVGARAGARGIVDGALTPVGSGYLVMLRLVSADSGRELARVSDAADSPKELIAVVGDLTRQLRGKMGESLKSVRASLPLPLARTSSLPALRKYTEAWAASYAGRSTDFRRLMKEAIALDTTFAEAYRSLINVNRNENLFQSETAELLRRAMPFRYRLPEQPRYWLEEDFYERGPIATRNADSAAAIRQRGLDRFPTAGNLNSAANEKRNAWDFAAAESLYRLSARMDTLYDFPLSNLAGVQSALGQREAAESTYRMLFRRVQPTAYTPARLLYRLIQGDTAGVIESARRGYDSTATDPDQRLTYANMARFLHALRGELREADRWRARYIETAKVSGRGSREMGYRLAYAVHLALVVGDSARATRLIDSVVTNVFPKFDVLERPYATLVNAYLAVGRVDRAKAALNDLKKNVGDGDALDRQIRIPRARIALAEKRWDDALRDASTGVSIDEGFLTRGMAYAGRGDRDSAIVYFERFANMLEPNALYTPLVLRKLGELYDAKGDRPRALSWYRKFVGLWRRADAELQPQVTEVKRRIAELEALEARGR